MSIPWALVVFVVFLVLKCAKITAIADWSWAAVCSPLILWLVLVFAMIALGGRRR